jgi:hypothetical protein
MAQKIKKSVTVQIKKFHNLWQKLSSVYVLRPTASCNKYIEDKFSALPHISKARSKHNFAAQFLHLMVLRFLSCCAQQELPAPENIITKHLSYQ